MRCFFGAIRFAALALLLFCSVLASAQTITANINGTVTDSTGAVIPGAKVTATNLDTNVSTTTTSNNDGLYNLRFLQVGRYHVVIAVAGFTSRTLGPFTLEANQDAKIDVPMSVTGTTETVSVSASVAPLLNTENAQLGSTLDSAAIETIPLVGEQFVQLTMFTPGAVNTNPSALTASGQIAVNTGNNNGVSVNGNRVTTNNYLLDGVDVNDTLNNTVGYNVSPEALGQIQLTSSNANAEYGNVNGGDTVMLLKSGTNQFHGEAYYFLGDYILDANTWANKNRPAGSIVPKSSYTQPIFGGTIGGPILRDRLFFFGDYEGGRFHTGGLGSASVITAKMRTGDFSELLDNTIMNGKTVKLYDASTTAYTLYNNNQLTIQNPVAKYLFAHPEIYPLPNAKPTNNTPDTGNYVAPSKSRQYNNQFDVKIDAKFSQRDSLMVRWLQSNNGSTSTPVLPTSFPTAPTTPVKGIAINEIHTFSASMVNEFRAGYTRIRPQAGLPVDSTGAFGANGNAIVGIGASNQGIVGFGSNSAVPAGTSGLTTANGAEYSAIGNSYGGMTYVDNSFTYGDDFTYLKNKHTLKMGVQFIRYQSNCFSPGNDGVLGLINYTGLGTSNPNSGSISAGYSMADFVLNRVAYAGQGVFSGPQGLRQWRDAYFAQDDWRATSKLTINFGMRYEYDQPMYEVNNKYTSVDFSTKKIVFAGTPAADALGGKSLVFPYYGDWQPRVGFAYSVTPRLVVRGGYGVQTFMEATGETRRMTINPPNNADNYSVGIAGSPTTAAQYFTVQNAFSVHNGVPPVSLNVWDPHIRPAFINEYSLTTEYQVSNTGSLRLGYVGEQGQHLVNHMAANQLTAPCIIGGVVQANFSSAACIASNPAPFYSLAGQTGSITYTQSNAGMNYNALQVSYRQRMNHGLEYTVNYTFSKAMTNAVGFFQVANINGGSNYAENAYDNHAEYGPTGQDVNHGINGNLLYELPIGRGRMFGSKMPLVLDEIVGGWKIGLTAVAYTGFPVTLTATNHVYTNNKYERPNQLRQMKKVNRSVNNWFGTDPSVAPCTAAGIDNGTCAYLQPLDGTYGSAKGGSERTPGYQDYDASIAKSFSVYHEQKLTFRVDASNALNLTALGNPNPTISSASFGQITSVRSGPRRLQIDLKYMF